MNYNEDLQGWSSFAKILPIQTSETLRKATTNQKHDHKELVLSIDDNNDLEALEFLVFQKKKLMIYCKQSINIRDIL
jgi:hypothetical protein